MLNSTSYHSYVIESLRYPQEAAAYLLAVLEDGNLQQFCKALRNVLEAKTYANQDNLAEFDGKIKDLFFDRNPDLSQILGTLNTLGFTISITPIAP
jgi:DNA-binding phage protein